MNEKVQTLDEQIDQLADAVEITVNILRGGGNSIRSMLTEWRAAREGHEGQQRNTVAFMRELAAANARIVELEKQNAELKMEVIAFCGPWAVQHARDHALPPGSLHSVHYDILDRCGARMDDFTRHEDAAREPGDE